MQVCQVHMCSGISCYFWKQIPVIHAAKYIRISMSVSKGHACLRKSLAVHKNWPQGHDTSNYNSQRRKLGMIRKFEIGFKDLKREYQLSYQQEESSELVKNVLKYRSMRFWNLFLFLRWQTGTCANLKWRSLSCDEDILGFRGPNSKNMTLPLNPTLTLLFKVGPNPTLNPTFRVGLRVGFRV
jgi:hypothetical protein